MTFDYTIGVGTIIEIATSGAGIAGMWFTMRERVAQLTKRDEAQEKQHEENQRRLSSLELQIARDCVKTDDFRRLEDRILAKFEKVEHTVNNASLRMVGTVKDMLRDILPPRGTRGSGE